MSYFIDPRENLDAAVRRIGGEQISKALDEIEDSNLDVHETVHQVRKRCKKLRGLLRLVRPALGENYREENARFRDAARLLSSFRDATSLLECFQELLQHYQKHDTMEVLAPLGETLAARRDRLDVDDELEKFAAAMRQARGRLEDWHLAGAGFEAVRGGFEKTYRRACRGMARAYEETTAADLHEWRKRAKYHWYHIRLLKAAWPAALAVRGDALDELSNLLGHDHDLAVLRKRLQEENFGELYGVVQLIEMRRRDLQALAHPLGRRLFCEKPRQLGRRLECYWQSRLEEAALPVEPVR